MPHSVQHSAGGGTLSSCSVRNYRSPCNRSQRPGLSKLQRSDWKKLNLIRKLIRHFLQAKISFNSYLEVERREIFFLVLHKLRTSKMTQIIFHVAVLISVTAISASLLATSGEPVAYDTEFFKLKCVASYEGTSRGCQTPLFEYPKCTPWSQTGCTFIRSTKKKTTCLFIDCSVYFIF